MIIQSLQTMRNCFEARDPHDTLSSNSHASGNRWISDINSFFNKVKGIFRKNEVNHVQPQSSLKVLLEAEISSTTSSFGDDNKDNVESGPQISHQKSSEIVINLDNAKIVPITTSSRDDQQDNVEREPQSSEQNQSVIIHENLNTNSGQVCNSNDVNSEAQCLEESAINPGVLVADNIDNPQFSNTESEFYEECLSPEDVEECPICLEEYNFENPEIVAECSHTFHLSCIYDWMERSQECPLCFRVMVFSETD